MAASERGISGFSDQALRCPGNVRELAYHQRAVVMGKTTTAGVGGLLQSMIAARLNDAPLEKAVAKGYTLYELEREYIQRIMENTKGNRTEAARILGVDRTTLYRKLDEYKVTD